MKNLALEEKMPRNMKILPITRILEAMLRSANVILLGISPSSKNMGHWDLSQSHVQDVSGIDPNVKKRGFWDQSHCLVQVVSGIAPN